MRKNERDTINKWLNHETKLTGNFTTDGLHVYSYWTCLTDYDETTRTLTLLDNPKVSATTTRHWRALAYEFDDYVVPAIEFNSITTHKELRMYSLMSGSPFFSVGTMRYWNTKFVGDIRRLGDSVLYITKDTAFNQTQYSVRALNRDATHDTNGRFDTLAQAKRYFNSLV